MVFQVLDLLLQLLLPLADAFALLLQLLQLLQLVADLGPLTFCLGQCAGTVMAATVFQFLQLLCQVIAGTALITGSDQSIEPAA